MKYMGVNEIREAFLSFFEQKNHLRMKSFPLIPENDKSLLLINAGMAPFKPYFTGVEVPPNKRIATCQKCIRTNDIENVGKTARHATLFEMLGNFSFGDYFKEEIIPWAWEFCTEVLEMPQDRLYVTVYNEDDEAYNIWHDKVGLPKEKIFRMGKEDNFWEVGTGPCGPDSEIFFDRGEKYGCGKDTCTVGCDCDRYIEFWNLVFTQFNKEEDGTYTPLSHPNIDTGMGLERMAVIMQDVYSIFDIDTMKAIRDKICQIANVKYFEDETKDVSIRIITDHIRAVTFMLADGVLPNNEGRGYVLRRLLRRAARHGKTLGIKEQFMPELAKVVIEHCKGAYPELLEKQDYILKIIAVEEGRFYETLDQGLDLLRQYIAKSRQKAQTFLAGIDAFKLYDTFGFPIELMREILEEEKLGIDDESFYKEMEKQREMSRTGREESNFMGGDVSIYAKLTIEGTTEFLGYDTLVVDGVKVLAIIAEDEISQNAIQGSNAVLILNKTPFYAESGGQTGDTGRIAWDGGEFTVNECHKVTGGKFAHIGLVKKGEIKTEQLVKAEVNQEKRQATQRNHTATHLVQKALREVLGKHVEQAGSYVSPDRMRFDFTHFESMAPKQLADVEKMVNDVIFEAMDVSVIDTDIKTAKDMGAMALFGEKYGEHVRVVKVEDFSTELCGGTHVDNTSKIGLLKILGESGVSAGVRRMECLTGKNALAYYQRQENVVQTFAGMLKAAPENIIKKTETFLNQVKELRMEVDKLKSNLSKDRIGELIAAKENIGGHDVVIAKIDNVDMNGLRTIGDKIKDKLQSGVLVLFSTEEDKLNLVVMATDDSVSKGIHAGNIIKEIAPVVGGKGGGKPNMAQAGGKDIHKIDEALQLARTIIETQTK